MKSPDFGANADEDSDVARYKAGTDVDISSGGVNVFGYGFEGGPAIIEVKIPPPSALLDLVTL